MLSIGAKNQRPCNLHDHEYEGKLRALSERMRLSEPARKI